jgi:pimeloyl-ACP methyl ester carboxylesterase
MSRRELSFDSQGVRCAAWFYEGGPACVVMAHGFAGVRVARLDAYAERFAAAGYSVLVFDYRCFGDSDGSPRQLLSIGMQLDDWRAAIAYARSLDGVEKIVLWGTSFSGGHVMVMAAEDPDIAAAISQNPFVDGVPTLAALGPVNALRLTRVGLRDAFAMARRRPPVLAPAVGQPGTTAAMTSLGADEGYHALFPPGYSWRNEVAARIFLAVGLYRPVRKARSIRCPWLVVAADDDLVTPPGPARKASLRAPRGELRRVGGGHWDIYVGDGFDEAVSLELEFMQRHVPVPAEVVAA